MSTKPTSLSDGSSVIHAASPEPSSEVSRRTFMVRSTMATALAAFTPTFLADLGKAKAAVLPQQMILDALGGLVALFVPGTAADPYSVQQGVTSSTPGGVEGNALAPLMFSLNGGGLAPPPFDSLSELVAFALGQVSAFVNPAPSGPFMSPFANLTFGEKVAVFQIMESGMAGQDLKILSNTLPILATYSSYSEAGVFNPFTGQLVTTPLGWILTGYGGVSDGHADFQGYYRGRKAAIF